MVATATNVGVSVYKQIKTYHFETKGYKDFKSLTTDYTYMVVNVSMVAKTNGILITLHPTLFHYQSIIATM